MLNIELKCNNDNLVRCIGDVSFRAEGYLKVHDLAGLNMQELWMELARGDIDIDVIKYMGIVRHNGIFYKLYFVLWEDNTKVIMRWRFHRNV